MRGQTGKKKANLGKINQKHYQINVIPFQTITERAFDGLNNLKRLNLEHNRLKMLERGLFTATPALTFLNLMRNSLETVTLHTIQPLMNNLVNHTSTLLIKGNLCFESCSLCGVAFINSRLTRAVVSRCANRLMAFASATQSLNLWTLPFFLGLINYSSFRPTGKPTWSP